MFFPPTLLFVLDLLNECEFNKQLFHFFSCRGIGNQQNDRGEQIDTKSDQWFGATVTSAGVDGPVVVSSFHVFIFLLFPFLCGRKLHFHVTFPLFSFCPFLLKKGFFLLLYRAKFENRPKINCLHSNYCDT